MEIIIRAAGIEARAELDDTPAAQAIGQALPLTARANTWGNEVYFRVPVSRELDETAAELVETGDLGYWPSGNAFCIFYGPTPISGPGEIRPASAVNIVGRVTSDAKEFFNVPDGGEITLTRA